MARKPDESTIWTKQFFSFIGIGLVVAAVVVAIFLWGTRKAHLELTGNIQKTRIQATDDNSSVAVLDFRIKNPSEVQFVVKQVDVIYVDQDGSQLEGMVAADVDARRLLDYYTTLGPKYNKTLVVKDAIEPGQQVDRMVMASFPLPEARLTGRKNLILRITDVDGAVSDLYERPQ